MRIGFVGRWPSPARRCACALDGLHGQFATDVVSVGVGVLAALPGSRCWRWRRPRLDVLDDLLVKGIDKTENRPDERTLALPALGASHGREPNGEAAEFLLWVIEEQLRFSPDISDGVARTRNPC